MTKQLRLETLEDRRVLATFMVSNLDATGPGSLYDAVAQANDNLGAHEIFFQTGLSGTISLTDKINISDELLIDGPGSEAVTIDGALGARGAFDIIRTIATIEGVTIANFESTTGAVRVAGSQLHVSDVTFHQNSSAFRGSGIFAIGSSLLIEKSTFSDNTLLNFGGLGAAIYSQGAEADLPLVIRQSSFINNSNPESEGGAITTQRMNLLIDSSTFANNNARAGGAICALSGSMSIVNSTISGNRAEYGSALMGGSSTSTEIRNSTIANNVATGFGGQSGVAAFLDRATVSSSIFSNIGDADFDGATLEVHNSILGSITNSTVAGDDYLVGVDPMLGELADNGGPTWTHEILPGSPAIDAGQPLDAYDASLPTTDQRGNGRIRYYGERIDMGAIEFQPDEINMDVSTDGLLNVDDLDALIAAVANGNSDDQFDMNADGRVNLFDRDAWLVEAGSQLQASGEAYSMGDANLDGRVDGADFVAWNSHKFTATPAWSAGDFDASGMVDGVDFVAWNSNKTFGSTAARTTAEDSTNKHCQEDSRTTMLDRLFAMKGDESLVATR